MAQKRTAAQMARLVARWRTSGESRAAFARRHGVSGWSFWYWCRKLSETAPPRTAAPMFVPVRVTQEAEAPSIEIVLSDGARVRVREGTPVEWVRAVVMALRSAC
jgi:transposase-like protein